MTFNELKANLYSAVLSDVLDEFGRPHQAMRPFIRPIDDGVTIMGRARTGRYVNVHRVEEGENPYEVEIDLIDDLKPGDVVVLGCGGPTDRIAPWGELLSTAAFHRKAEGCVTDGLVRDVARIRQMGFGVFHGGIGPLDTRGRARMVERDKPAECAGVLVNPGDIVFGDLDGVVVVPQDIEQMVLDRAVEKTVSENHTREELENGLLLKDVYEKYGVL